MPKETKAPTHHEPNGPGRRGRPNIIDRERIIEAAVEVGLEVGIDELSMTNVADRLGVNRSTLNYHVRNRDELVELVATAVFDFNMDPRWMLDADTDWRDWIRAFAIELRRSLLAHRPLALYFRFSPGVATGALEQGERFFAQLFAAGFDAEGASKAVTYIAQVVFMCVRDELMTRTTGRHPQDDEMATALDQLAPDEMPSLRRVMAAGGRARPDEQFAFDLECVISGLEAHLALRRS